MNPSQPNEVQREVHNPLAAMQPGEQVICEIKRHPIGIIGVYVVAGLLLTVLAVAVFIIAPLALKNVSSSRIMEVGGLGYIVVLLATLLVVYIGNTVYSGNRWIVTSDSITQVQQTSLFSKQSSQLSMASLEDITAQQDGIFQQMFHYGVLAAETAGERSKFRFIYCPNPNQYAQLILNAREQFEQERRGYSTQNQPAGDAQTQTQPYQA
jgi:hypothetical protein